MTSIWDKQAQEIVKKMIIPALDFKKLLLLDLYLEKIPARDEKVILDWMFNVYLQTKYFDFDELDELNKSAESLFTELKLFDIKPTSPAASGKALSKPIYTAPPKLQMKGSAAAA